MIEKIKEFAEIRTAIENAQDLMKAKLEAVKQSTGYKELAEYVESELPILTKLESEIKKGALDTFAAKGNKKPWDGVGIREMTKIEYDERLAVAYCQGNYAELLTVSKKPFEKLCLGLESAGVLPKFVIVRKEPSAYIASDLSVYLEKENA
jgi:hypothetical protein